MNHAKRQDSGTSPPVSPPPTSPPPSQVTSPPPTSPPTSPPSSPPTSPPSSPPTPPPTSEPDLPSSIPSNGGGGGPSSVPSQVPSGDSSAPASAPSQTAPPQSSASSAPPRPQTQMSTSFFVGTNSAGQVFTSTVISTTIVTPTIAPANGGTTATSNSHVGPIVGGVIGGIALLVAIIFGATWWVRKRGHHDDFDGDFDPDRVTPGKNTGADLDLAGGGAEVTPYSYAPGQVQGLGGVGVEPQMSQQQPYGVSGAVSPISPTGSSSISGYGGLPPTGFSSVGPPPSSFPPNFNQPSGASAFTPSGPSAPSAYSEPSAYSGSEPPSQYPDYAAYAAYNAGTVVGQHPGGTGPHDFRHPSPGPSLALDGSEQSSSARGGGVILPSSKEREAMAERLHVANEPNSSGPSANSPVHQHLDGGRLDVPVVEAPQEIPPSYDSIPR